MAPGKLLPACRAQLVAWCSANGGGKLFASDRAVFGVIDEPGGLRSIRVAIAFQGRGDWHAIEAPKNMSLREALGEAHLDREFDRARPLAYSKGLSGTAILEGKKVRLPKGWWNALEYAGNPPTEALKDDNPELSQTLYKGGFVDILNLKVHTRYYRAPDVEGALGISGYMLSRDRLVPTNSHRRRATLLPGRTWLLMKDTSDSPLSHPREWNALAAWLQRLVGAKRRIDQKGTFR